MSTPTYVDASGAKKPDRRRNPELRARFEEAYRIVEPFFEAENEWSGHSLDHMAYRVLREQMPSLSQDEVHVIVVAAARVFQSQRGRA